MANTVLADGAGGALVAGQTRTFLGPNQTGFDAFVRHYDRDGNLLWDRRLATEFGDSIEGLAPDGQGGFYVSGNTEGSLAGTNPTPVADDPFVARYDGSGNLLWVRQLNLPGQDFAGRVAADSLGGVLVTGAVATALSGETSAGQLDAFIAYFSENGDLLWKDQFGSDKADYAYGIGADGLGNVFAGGYTWGNLFGTNHGGGGGTVRRISGPLHRQRARGFRDAAGTSDGASGQTEGTP